MKMYIGNDQKIHLELNETQLLFIMESIREIFSYGFIEKDYEMNFGVEKSLFVEFSDDYEALLEKVGIEY